MIPRPRPSPFQVLHRTHRPQCLTPPSRHPFSASALVRAAESTHYETLGVSPSATSAEIKQQFYALSKTHHPDRNPTDPTASTRFVRISEAYHVLGSPAKRSQYDHDLARSSPAYSSSSSSAAARSHAGSRPPSGLSRRKTQFRGPPPSFYRSGGWGAQGEKRSAYASGAAGAQAGGHSSSSAYGAAGSGHHYEEAFAASASQGGGFGFGQGHAMGFDNDVPHFDREGHFRTQQDVEHFQSRRRRRRPEDVLRKFVPGEGTGGTAFSFFLVGGIVLLAMGAPALALFGDSGGRNRRDDS